MACYAALVVNSWYLGFTWDPPLADIRCLHSIDVITTEKLPEQYAERLKSLSKVLCFSQYRCHWHHDCCRHFFYFESECPIVPWRPRKVELIQNLHHAFAKPKFYPNPGLQPSKKNSLFFGLSRVGFSMSTNIVEIVTILQWQKVGNLANLIILITDCSLSSSSEPAWLFKAFLEGIKFKNIELVM